jgi:hypothetical protein
LEWTNSPKQWKKCHKCLKNNIKHIDLEKNKYAYAGIASSFNQCMEEDKELYSAFLGK